MKNPAKFNAQEGTDSTHTAMDDKCSECDGVGHVHCPDCGKAVRCRKCGGSGKKSEYRGFIYTIHWE